MTTVTTFLNGLLSHWPFDSDYDDAAGSNDGTPAGSPSFVPGAVSQAVSLPTVNDYINIGNVLNFGADDSFTLSAIFNFSDDTDAGQEEIITKAISTVVQGYFLAIQPALGRVKIVIGDDSSNIAAVTIDNVIVKDTFYRLTGRVNRLTDRMDLFLNEMGEDAAPVSMGNVDISSVGTLTTSHHLRIGRAADNNQRFKGIIDDVRIYDRALTNLEVCGLGAWPNRENNQCHWADKKKASGSWSEQN